MLAEGPAGDDFRRRLANEWFHVSLPNWTRATSSSGTSGRKRSPGASIRPNPATGGDVVRPAGPPARLMGVNAPTVRRRPQNPSRGLPSHRHNRRKRIRRGGSRPGGARHVIRGRGVQSHVSQRGMDTCSTRCDAVQPRSCEEYSRDGFASWPVDSSPDVRQTSIPAFRTTTPAETTSTPVEVSLKPSVCSPETVVVRLAKGM